MGCHESLQLCIMGNDVSFQEFERPTRFSALASKEDFHSRVMVDQAEGLCH